LAYTRSVTCYSISLLHRFHDGRAVQADDISVVIGMHKLDDYEPSKIRHMVRRIVTHEQYVFPNYDIALLLLTQRIEFNYQTRPICVDNSTFPDNTSCFATGWGYTYYEEGKYAVRCYLHIVVV